MAILADLFLNRKHNSIRQYDIKGILPIFLAFFGIIEISEATLLEVFGETICVI